MKNLDERLREALHDERLWSLPIPADAVDVVEEGARRIRRRRRIGMVAGAVVAALTAGLSVSALRTGSDGVDPATLRPAARLEVVKRLDQSTFDPVLFNGSIYLYTDTGKVLRVSPTTGKTLMTRDLHQAFMVNGDGATEPGVAYGSLMVSGGHLWAQIPTGLLQLDPVTLRITRTVPFPKPAGRTGPPTSAIASPAAFWIVNGAKVLRLDGATGAVTASLTVTGNLPPAASSGPIRVISADDKAGVVWMLNGMDTAPVATLMAAKVTGDRLEVIGSMPFEQPSTGSPVLAPGPDGSLWTGGAKTVAHYAPQAAGRGLRSLPIGDFPVTEWLAKGRQLSSTSNGTRLWIAVPNAAWTSGTMLCLDGSTGTVLEHYPLALNNGESVVTVLPETGDAHEVLLQPGHQVLELHGPDRCLT